MSGTTMSLSGARPILIEPGGVCTVRPGCRIFSMLVARLLVLECGAAAGAIDVAHSAAGAGVGCGAGGGRGGDRRRHRGRTGRLAWVRLVRRRGAPVVGLRPRWNAGLGARWVRRLRV